tara:strand:- start:318 stop:503 length:186 start_codon:yes stop_codon:yes gene_type:complete
MTEYKELKGYAVTRFVSAYQNHTIKNEVVDEIERTLNTLTEKIYNPNSRPDYPGQVQEEER